MNTVMFLIVSCYGIGLYCGDHHGTPRLLNPANCANAAICHFDHTGKVAGRITI